MKKATILIIILAICSGLFAQHQSDSVKVKKFRNMGLEFSAGYSMVMGSYAALDKSNTKAGYATNGWMAQLTYHWLGPKDFGVAIQYTFQNNPLDDYTKSLRPDGWSSGSLGPGSWSNHYLLFGPVFIKTFKKVFIDAKILGGLIVSSSANFTTPDPTDTSGMKRDINLGTGFGYGISAGIGYAFSSHIAIKVSANFMGGWPTKNKQYSSQFLFYKEYRDPVTGLIVIEPIYSAPVTYEIKKLVATFNVTLGLVYRF
ncbi:MAG: hypothetical protein WCP32_14750 [Bacteroidota bacterium]